MEEKTAFPLLAVILQCTWLDQSIKNIPQLLFAAIHFSTCVSYDLFFNLPPPLCVYVRIQSNPPFYISDFIDFILSSPILTLLVCHSFLILFYLRNSRIHVFVSDTHHVLASHSVSSSLPRKVFLLMLASNCQLFYLS